MNVIGELTKGKEYLLPDVRGGHTKLLKKKKNQRTTTHEY